MVALDRKRRPEQGSKVGETPEPFVGNEKLDDPVHSPMFIMLTCLRSSSGAGGHMTCASISRYGNMPVAHKEACAFHEQSRLRCRGSTPLLELEGDCSQHHPEQQVDGKRGKEPPKIEAERRMMAHDVGKQL